MADSSGEVLPFALQRQVVFYRTTVVPGSIVVDRENRFLYLIHSSTSARRYGIGVAQECLKGGTLSRVMNKLEWPDWRSAGANTKEADALLAAAGRPGSPLGARALLLDKPGLLIHGTNSPKTIGHLVASGCIRLVTTTSRIFIDAYRWKHASSSRANRALPPEHPVHQPAIQSRGGFRTRRWIGRRRRGARRRRPV